MIVVVTYEYPPEIGGIGTYSYNVAKAFSDVVVVSKENTNSDFPIFADYLKKKGAGYINGWRLFKWELESKFTVRRKWPNTYVAIEIDAAYPALLVTTLTVETLYLVVLGNDILLARKGLLRRILSSLLYLKCRKIIAISESTKALLPRWVQKKTIVVHPGVDI